MPNKVRSFTVVYPGPANVLLSKALIGPAFDPNTCPEPHLVEFEGVWDTGATFSAISQRVVDQCGLQPIGMAMVHTANGVRDSLTYLICIKLPNDVGFPLITATLGELGDIDLLIGMDVIGAGDFAVSAHGGHTTFSYRYPSIAKADFVSEAQAKGHSTQASIGRNNPCPCGSGKKHKKCCGKIVLTQ